jgi:hypothetical protein
MVMLARNSRPYFTPRVDSPMHDKTKSPAPGATRLRSPHMTRAQPPISLRSPAGWLPGKHIMSLAAGGADAGMLLLLLLLLLDAVRAITTGAGWSSILTGAGASTGSDSESIVPLLRTRHPAARSRSRTRTTRSRSPGEESKHDRRHRERRPRAPRRPSADTDHASIRYPSQGFICYMGRALTPQFADLGWVTVTNAKMLMMALATGIRI